MKRRISTGRSVRRLAMAAVLIPAIGRAQLADVVISEFMTRNSTLRDENGETPDWVEFFNNDDQPADMDGWYVTDDLTDRTKWRFPAVTIPSKGFLVVFASDKDRRDPSSPLHLNFKLTSLGEDLALVAPDGATIVSSYLPYPPLPEEFSYGLQQHGQQVRFIREGDPATALVPSNGNDALDWTQATFNDAGWKTGTTGVGYDQSSTYIPHINLDVDAEMNDINTTCYIRVPFQVEDPTTVSSLVLRMKYDDGFIAYLNGTLLEQQNGPADPSWNSTSTGQHDDGAAVIFQEFSVPVPADGLRQGENVLAVHGLNRSLGSSDFLITPELDGLDVGELNRDEKLFFPQPTPGAGNLPGFEKVLPKPSFFPSARVFTGTINVTLEGPAGSVVRYTTNGAEPTSSSTIADGPIVLSSSTLIRARTFDAGGASAVTSHGYVAITPQVADNTSDLPILLIDNFGGGGPPSDPLRPAYLTIFENPGNRTRLDTQPVLQTRIGIKVRGSSSQGLPKKSYKWEAWDERNEDKNIEPLGLPREADWILYGAIAYDLTHLHNPMMYELSNRVGRYATRSRFCEVYFNTGGGVLSDSDYIGLYSFLESIKRDDNRVDVERLSPGQNTEPEISGGYMMKIDRADPGESGFGAAGQTIRYVYPKERNITSAQATWLRNYMNAFGNALNSSNFRDPQVGYLRFVDRESWVDHHILNVLAYNVDALRLSTYFFKHRNGKIEYGPIWDFDRALNSTDGRDDNPEGWNPTGGTDFFSYPWWSRLFQDPDFWQVWRDRWHLFRQSHLSTGALFNLIDSMADEIREAQARDSARWGQTSVSGWNNQINAMKSWLSRRVNWIDSQFLSVPALSSPTRQISTPFSFSMDAPAGAIYYTLDGTDPRGFGGNVSPDAVRFDGGIITVNETVRVTARARTSASMWSAPVSATYYTERPPIVITELMYHPPDLPAGSLFSDEDFEFVEFLNISNQPLELEGIRFTDGIEFTFPQGTLDPGEYVVIVNNLEAFELRYDTSEIFVAGEYTGRLENAGEPIELIGPLHEPIHLFTYDDLWYPETDGGDASLVIRDPFAPASTWVDKDSWAPSTVVGGSPGDDDEGFSITGGRQRIGDSNQDGRLDISDAISLMRRLFGDGAQPLPCEGAAITDGGNLTVLDTNGDVQLNIADVTYILNYLFANGPAPALGESCFRIEGCPNVCLF